MAELNLFIESQDIQISNDQNIDKVNDDVPDW
jgi:hypothetical protein